MRFLPLLALLIFTGLEVKAACLTIEENPENLSAICRKQITNYFRYHRGWAKNSCNGIYSYRVTAPNTVQLKYTENGCDARLVVSAREENNFCFVHALAPFPDTVACGK